MHNHHARERNKSCTKKGPLSCYPVKARDQGLRRPTATGSENTSDKSQGADLNITLIAEQIGRSPVKEKSLSLVSTGVCGKQIMSKRYSL